MGTRWLRSLALAVVLSCFAELASAQIYYTVPGPLDATGRPTAILHRVNPDGTGDVVVQLPGVPAPQVPTFSRDGRFLAVTSLDPSRPTDQSQSVFELDLATSLTRRLIFFQDVPDNAGTGTLKFVPTNKAYSPNNDFMALSVTIESFGGFPLSLVRGLQIHDLSGGLPVAFLLTTLPLDSKSTAGVGVDWSPDGTRLAYPLASVGPNGVEPVTPLYRIDPNTGNVVQPITFPVDELINLLNPRITRGEHDYAPAYSPNGQAIAYLRASQTFNSFGSIFDEPFLEVSVRITSPAGDRSIVDLSPNFIASSVRWSPDGTQLVFDVAPRATLFNGIPILQPNSSLLETYTVGVDGTGLTQVAGPPAGQPEWAPVPEPSRGLMLGAGIVLLSWLRRRSH